MMNGSWAITKVAAEIVAVVPAASIASRNLALDLVEGGHQRDGDDAQHGVEDEADGGRAAHVVGQ